MSPSRRARASPTSAPAHAARDNYHGLGHTSDDHETVVRIEDLVCSEPVNNIATCVDPQGRIVTRVDDPRQATTTVPQEAQRPVEIQPHGDVVVRDAGSPQPSAGRRLALTG